MSLRYESTFCPVADRATKISTDEIRTHEFIFTSHSNCSRRIRYAPSYLKARPERAVTIRSVPVAFFVIMLGLQLAPVDSIALSRRRFRCLLLLLLSLLVGQLRIRV